MFRLLVKNVGQKNIIQFTRLSTTPVPLKKKNSAEKHKIQLEEGMVIFSPLPNPRPNSVNSQFQKNYLLLKAYFMTIKGLINYQMFEK